MAAGGIFTINTAAEPQKQAYKLRQLPRMRALLTSSWLLIISYSVLAQEQNPCQFHSLGVETTPMGRTLEYRSSAADSLMYHVYLKLAEKEVKIGKDFFCNRAPVTRPWFDSENDNYVLLIRGCGAACKVGYLIPTDPSQEITIMYNWLDANLESEIIVSLGSDEEGLIVKVQDLRYNEVTEVKTNLRCNAAIINGCTDSISFSGRSFSIDWDPQVSTTPFSMELKK